MIGGPAKADRTADAIVIGAGIVGAATAFELSRSGLKVIVLERGAPNREGSGATEGNFHIQALSPRPLGRIRDSARWVPLQVIASRLWGSLETELEAPVGVQRVGGFSVAETEDQLEIVRMEHRLELEGGIATQLMTGDEARSAYPLLSRSVIGAVYTPEDGFANALQVAPAYLRAACARGACVHAFTPVTAIKKVGSGFEVTAGGETWHAGVVVNAAGPWLHLVSEMAGHPLELLPMALQVVATELIPPTMSSLVQVPLGGLIVKQAAAGNVLIGGGWPGASLNLSGRSPLSVANLIGNVRIATRVLPFLRDYRVIRAWTGPYAVTPDELPVVGELSVLSGFFVVGGPLSFTHGPTWGKVICDLVLGRVPMTDVADFGPDRLLTNRPRLPKPD